ncbi:FHA domain-containing protein [Thermocaproicibacter melissae]|uniref:FHA domain-containing protein n=1 Tax=Thermocaproicibacter melissae TaxID=2966552 RepID=UPI0024B0D97F|nr:FHA domain-containing protein [Thermocaproicibacter melissae]WBY64027.1 FHA domain-containing protein [Thermocaproicibacter melissae]
MNGLVQRGICTELKVPQNIAYLLNDGVTFFLTGYKVLQSQEKRGFVRCARLMYNGKVELVYFTSAYQPLSALLPKIGIHTFMQILVNLLGKILEVEANGFLDCHNLDLSVDKIFVDADTHSVFLIYLPVSVPSDDPGNANFENELRADLIRLIQSTPNFVSPTMAEICTKLADGTMSLERLCRFLTTRTEKNSKPCGKGQPPLTFTAINAPETVSFHITTPEFVIGKNAAAVQGAVTFNRAISRVHCKITFAQDRYFVTDLNSANGTFVNRTRIEPQKPVPIQDGDVVRLANSDFMVRISGGDAE